MMRRSRVWISGLSAVLLWGVGCTKGVGESCETHAECEPGLACVDGACSSCGRGNACVGVDLIVKSCSENTDPMSGVLFFKLSITGHEMTPITREVIRSEGHVELPGIPMGRNRQVRIEGYATADAVAPISVGASDYFDLDPKSPVAPVVVFLRRTDAFTPVSSKSDPGTCGTMATARASHTATRLQDGRVLIAGGYGYDEAGATVYLGSVEIYEPSSGRFVEGASLKQPRSGHTATLLSDGRVFVAGGEAIVTGTRSALVSGELYDPEKNEWTLMSIGQARMRHAATLLQSGEVLLSGGFERASDSQPTKSTTLVNPDGVARPGPMLQEHRADHTTIVVRGGDRLVVIGGMNGSGAISTYEMFGYLSGSLVAHEQVQSLGGGRAGPFVAPFNLSSGAGLLVLGNPGGGGGGDGLGWSWIKLDETGTDPDFETNGSVPVARSGACAASFGRGVVIAGGQSSGGVLETADLFVAAEGGFVAQPTTGVLGAARTRAACTALGDGSVLVTGGDLSVTKTVSALGEIYRP